MSERIISFYYFGKEYNITLTDVHAWQFCELLRKMKVPYEIALWFSRDYNYDPEKTFIKIIKN